jgi:DNA-binding CsgD family transcriptional regulator
MNQDATLSNRETQVAELLAWGAAKKEVADMLTISTRTVENIARNIYAKIGIQKATELCVWWFTTKCGVSMNLSPFARKVGALFLFLLLTPTMFGQNNPDMARCRTAKTCRTVRAARGRRADTDTDFEFINL